MKNIPRIFIGDDISSGDIRPAPREMSHYLTRVMRTDTFLAFGGGAEYNARMNPDGKSFMIGDKTSHADPSGKLTLYFAPIKRSDDLINMATQMGVARFVPVVTARTVASHINWDRMHKIAVEASEQSNRNSVPEIMPPVRFADLDLSGMVFADERAAYGRVLPAKITTDKILVGPEGGFSPDEFDALDAAGARGVALGKTILRAEVAALVAVSRVME